MSNSRNDNQTKPLREPCISRTLVRATSRGAQHETEEEQRKQRRRNPTMDDHDPAPRSGAADAVLRYSPTDATHAHLHRRDLPPVARAMRSEGVRNWPAPCLTADLEVDPGIER